MDETTVSLHPPLRRCWMRKGLRTRIPAPGSPLALHVFGGYHWHSGQVSYTTAAHKNSESFMAFVEHLMAQAPQRVFILVMDNASYHHSHAVQAALTVWADRVRVL